MLKLAGAVLDIHDDTTLRRFRELVPEDEREKIASGASLYSPEELEGVGDHRFGAIFHNSQDPSVPPRRCFLLTTPEHTKLSALYFLKAAAERTFPDPVEAAIAAQIRHGMDLHGIEPAEFLPAEKVASFTEMADRHGEWAPGDHFVDCFLYDAPPAPETEKFAFSKEASLGLRKYVLPVETEDDIRASIGAVISKTAMEDLDLDAEELSKAASAVKHAAETAGVDVPDSLVKLACVDPRAREDIEALLGSRLNYMNPEKRASRSGAIKTAMATVLEEQTPAALVAKIALLDQACGIGEKEYRRGCARPFDVVFQPGMKTADENAALLEECGGLDHVKSVLGEKVAAEFEKAPKATFEKQSKELKHLLLHARD